MIGRMNGGILAACALALAACDNGPSAVETRDRVAAAAETAVATTAEAVAGAPAEAAVPAKTPVTANRRETVDAKIARLYARNGAAFGATSAEDYLAKIEAFTRNPPRDAETVTRANGDRLIYQASTNTFAVVSGEGVARTMFKPDDGPAYWAEQKTRAPEFGRRRASGSSEG